MQIALKGAAPARIATSAAPKMPANKMADPVLVVGAGPAGMAVALELAIKGIRSVVFDKRGEIGTRDNLFNVVPAMADNLARLAPGGELTDKLVPTRTMLLDDLDQGRSHTRTFSPPGLAADPTRSRGDASALLAALKSPDDEGADLRAWSKIGIGDLETAMRQYAGNKYPDLIDMRFGTEVTGISQAKNGVQALISASADRGKSAAAQDAVKGSFLVDATGRNLLKADKLVYPETNYWIGGRFAGVGASGDTATHRSSAVITAERGSTIVLPNPDRTMVWTTSHVDGSTMDPAAKQSLVEERAATLGVTGGLVEGAAPMAVKMQLTESLKPARGRVYAVGDSLRAPYFPTSTGAATAIVHDAPRAADAIEMALTGTSTVAKAASFYNESVRSANKGVIAKSRVQLGRDVGVAPDQLGPGVKVSADDTLPSSP